LKRRVERGRQFHADVQGHKSQHRSGPPR
jgi:hypothetical protein